MKAKIIIVEDHEPIRNELELKLKKEHIENLMNFDYKC